MKVVKKVTKKEPMKVYDFTVEEVHHYILDNGVVSHNSYVPTNEMAGGGGIRYSASTIVYLSKKKDKVGTEVIGNYIRARAVKSRLTKENSEVMVKLSYAKGLDKYYGLLELGEKHGIFKKVSTRFEMPDGSKVFEKQVYASPEKYFTEDILKKLDEAARKEFSYGTGIAGDDDEPVSLEEHDET